MDTSRQKKNRRVRSRSISCFGRTTNVGVASRKLYRVASAQNMAHEQATRTRGHLRSHLHNRESGHVTLQGSEDPSSESHAIIPVFENSVRNGRSSTTNEPKRCEWPVLEPGHRSQCLEPFQFGILSARTVEGL